jgi:proteasome lid subunit RPN8/RPN11
MTALKTIFGLMACNKVMDKIFIPKDLLSEIISHCKEVYPHEACGILAGKDNAVRKIYKMTNIEQSGVSYLMEPKEQFETMKEMRGQVLEMTAIYHSHPSAEAYPSPKDINLAFYEDSLSVIVSLIHAEPAIKAFKIKDGIVEEVEIIFILQ